ncbi:MAG: FixH family protein [Blastocatellia bacterium]
MKAKSLALLLFAITLVLVTAACSKSGSSDSDRVIKSAKSSDMTVTLSNTTGELRSGDNELMVTFTDAAGKPVDVGAASLNIHMAGMGTMAEMNDKATLTTTDTPGKYRAQVNIEMKGTWEAQVKYQDAHGTGQISMNVQAK